MNTSLRLEVSDQSQAGEARRGAATWARDFGVPPELAATLALVVTELGTNLAIHTRGGALLLRLLGGQKECGVEVISVDTGPGVANFGACMRDGHSTSGTAGNGLGAVQRAANVFEVHSQVDIGTVLLCELWERSAGPQLRSFLCNGVSVPLAGEIRCGDSWSMLELESGHARLLVADGLGHGEFAATASQTAVDVFRRYSTLPLTQLLEVMHGALRATRGAAVAIAEVDASEGKVTYAGIGNISATILTRDKSMSLVSHNGTVGAQFRSMKEFTYPWSLDSSLVMQSDGIKSQWKLDRYTGLSGRHPGLVAGALYRDFQRPNDDSTVVVLQPRER